jgi:hypothetical protein
MRESKLSTLRISGWAELMEQLYTESWDSSIERFRSPWVFRGLCDASAGLNTSLMRLAAGYENLAKLEAHMLRNFRKYAHFEVDAKIGASVWNWLALAQHHGLQTRLLDWTYSPLVAVHFATDDIASFNRDGVIYCVNHRRANALLPDALRKQVEIEGFDVFTAEMLDRVADTLEKFDRLSKEEFVIFLEPPSIDSRIVNQFALFSLMNGPARDLETFLIKQPHLARRIVIPAQLKWEVRDKLDQAGITERMLYPGLDGLSRWLSRYYTPHLRKHSP